ncbi:MAG: hypothetical protein NZM37_02605 [Sandaracinaceae bacterium]|nr:hypothetical protein [Sandaracinaceae bacterium]
MRVFFRSPHRIRGIFVGLFYLLAPFGRAHADESSYAHLWKQPLAIEIQGGWWIPLGAIGGTLLMSPVEIRPLGVEVGGGYGPDGGRVAVGLRLTLPQDHFALRLRMGSMAGPLSWKGQGSVLIRGPMGQSESRDLTVTRYWDTSINAYADIGLEYRFDGGFYLGVMGGVETGFFSRADRCQIEESLPPESRPQCNTDGTRPIRLYLGMFLGYAIDFDALLAPSLKKEEDNEGSPPSSG